MRAGDTAPRALQTSSAVICYRNAAHFVSSTPTRFLNRSALLERVFPFGLPFSCRHNALPAAPRARACLCKLCRAPSRSFSLQLARWHHRCRRCCCALCVCLASLHTRACRHPEHGRPVKLTFELDRIIAPLVFANCFSASFAVPACVRISCVLQLLVDLPLACVRALSLALCALRARFHSSLTNRSFSNKFCQNLEFATCEFPRHVLRRRLRARGRESPIATDRACAQFMSRVHHTCTRGEKWSFFQRLPVPDGIDQIERIATHSDQHKGEQAQH